MADGCNWGERPKRAAERARNTVMAYLKERNTKIKTLEDAKLYLLRSFNEAHRRICEKSYPEEEIGSTTVLAGVTLELLTKNNNNNNEFAFVCASVGDCKAFKLDVETLTVFFFFFVLNLLSIPKIYLFIYLLIELLLIIMKR